MLTKKMTAELAGDAASETQFTVILLSLAEYRAAQSHPYKTVFCETRWKWRGSVWRRRREFVRRQSSAKSEEDFRP